MPNPDHSCQIAMEEQIEEILQVFFLVSWAGGNSLKISLDSSVYKKGVSQSVQVSGVGIFYW